LFRSASCKRRERRRKPNRSQAGFTLIEVLVALAVVAVALTAIGSLVATSVRGTGWLDRRLALIETARMIETGLPDRDQLKVGNFSGELADHRWRVDVLPFLTGPVPAQQANPWVPQTVVIRVQSPSGGILQIDTVRLRRRAAQ
jgi:general secretion pathway protein I